MLINQFYLELLSEWGKKSWFYVNFYNPIMGFRTAQMMNDGLWSPIQYLQTTNTFAISNNHSQSKIT